jgi:hypothetical protein
MAISGFVLYLTNLTTREIFMAWDVSPSGGYKIYRNENGGAFYEYGSESEGTDRFTDHVSANIRYGYYVSNLDGYGDSGELSGMYGEDALSHTITATPSISASVVMGITINHTITVSSLTTTQLDAVNTINLAITVTDSAQSASSIRADFSWYLADETGKVYTYSDAYLSDNGASISSQWRTKTLGFAELGYDWEQVWKTINELRLVYVDIDPSVPYSISWSTDGGITWNGKTKTKGTGGGITTDVHFYMVATGQYIDLKIECASTNKRFQIIGLDVSVDKRGDHFDITD